MLQMRVKDYHKNQIRNKTKHLDSEQRRVRQDKKNKA
jgi:hypothetical protein